MWKRLLVPHDFSRCAARALDVAAELAARSGGEITLLHVSPRPPGLSGDARITSPDGSQTMSVDEMLSRGAARGLAVVAAPLEARGIAVQKVARATAPGSPADAILRAADELGSDVIVLGAHGRGRLAELLLGSVAASVARGARVPVVTVRSGDESAHPTPEEQRVLDEVAG